MLKKIDLLKKVEVPIGGEVIEEILSQNAGRIRVEKIVSNHSSSEKDFWYDQSENEWVAVIQGQGIIEFESPFQEIELNFGEGLFIPAHTRHRVKSTSNETQTVWLAFFFGENSEKTP